MRAMDSSTQLSRGLCAAFLLLFFFLSEVEAQTGFISLDCGLQDGQDYIDNSTGLAYISDGDYVDGGEAKTVQADGFLRRYQTLRVFPEGERNCYNLRPLQPGAKYLVRAAFFYGNYDGIQRPPSFELLVGAIARLPIELSPNETSQEEVVAAANGDTVWVCLVNTGKGTPLISTIQLRPLPKLSYPAANASQTLLLQRRINLGAETQIRYPIDPYDRIWGASTGNLPVINTSRTVVSNQGDPFQVPSLVMGTAVTVPNISYPLFFFVVVGFPEDTVYVALHFAELQNTSGSNQTRSMDIFGFGKERAFLRNYSAPFLKAAHVTVEDAAVGPTFVYNISVAASNTTTLPPILNALEGFRVLKLDQLPTDLDDVGAVEDVKAAFKIERNWQGDPCVPKAYVWKGLRCSYGDSTAPRIVSLDLSSSGLAGELPSSIANLTALTTLDLSNNKISITVPDLLDKLPSLELLNLAGNKIKGVSEDFCKRALNGRRSRRIEGLEEVCSNSTKPSPTPTPTPIGRNPNPSSSVTNKQNCFVFVIITLILAIFV